MMGVSNEHTGTHLGLPIHRSFMNVGRYLFAKFCTIGNVNV